jgi:hypothetical protein
MNVPMALPAKSVKCRFLVTINSDDLQITMEVILLSKTYSTLWSR